MQSENQKTIQFEKFFEVLYVRFFKNKLDGKGFAIIIGSLWGFGFILSAVLQLFTPALVTTEAGLNMLASYSYTVTTITTLLTVLSIFITVSCIIRRVRDVVPDTSIWPFSLVAIIISLIPFINILFLILMVFVPTNYLNQEKRTELISKFA